MIMSRLGQLAVVVTVALSLTAAPAQARTSKLTPVVFVHGQQGSAQQWQSNAKRFSSNGYADKLLYAFEYDTSIPANDHAVAGLQALIQDIRGKIGSSTVDVIAHSRGTTVMHAFLADPARAGTVRRYVNVDGRSSASPPGGVPTLALWGSLQPNGSIGGATNVYLTTLGHTETTTSAEGFTHMYRFLRDRPAFTDRVLPESPGRVEISGRALYFPQNAGAAGLLQVWEVDDRTGARRGGPRDVVRVGADGSFGPLRVNGRKHYELVLVRQSQQTYHFYFEPFERSDHFLRLLVSPAGGIGDFIDKCAGHTALTVVRNREWWADQPEAGNNDRLLFNGSDLLAAGVAPRARQVIAAFAFDDNCDRVSVPGVALAPFNVLPFLTGVDTYLAAEPAGRPIRITQVARGAGGRSRTITVLNWASDQHTVSVLFKDYVDRR
jgi:pimeloyl-ACP methyl ester carboxylesterase